ncbi:autoinducer-2 kinase [Arsenicitalea aurantiaca]|uniref:Autoinducer-2 kinase n=1 Tax=Arsenicitalea aurantiaca TaxID=1783274 RepID=A0A433X478_9HYPH|nr:autoinducer-2 kinase [Arsenicitalea aurantiaca]RUT28858.1 autoinducer-2 kinase [Arsenicitalea aurantiaca]
MSRYYLAIDAGTGSGRAVLFDDDGRQVAASQAEWWHKSDPRFPGSMDFDIAGNWALIGACVKAAIAEAGISPDAIAAVSATSMREAIVAYDRAGKAIWACANVDSRAVDQVRRLQKERPELERALYGASGQTFALGALPRLLWIKENLPELHARIAHVSMISDWVLAELSGVIASDPSNGGTTGLLSLTTRDWLRGELEKTGLSSAILPQIHEPGTVIGAVTDAAAEATGLRAGTPVVMGGGDCQIGTAGLGVVAVGECAVFGGTFWQQIVNVGQEIVDPGMNLRLNPHVVPGINQAEAISFFVGAAMRWFRDAFGQEEMARAAETGADAYALLEEQSKAVPPGAHGIIPILSDVMRYGRWYHAAPSLLNLSIDAQKAGKPAIFRALQENAAIVAARNLDAIFTLSGRRPERIVFAAGAAKSPHWAQMLATVTGLPVVTPRVKEATAMGCAAAAAIGAGRFADFSEAASAWVRWDARFEPEPHLKGLYDEAGERWAAAYRAQIELVDRGITTSMWKAPGL